MRAANSVPLWQRLTRSVKAAPRYRLVVVDRSFTEAQALTSALGEEFGVTFAPGLHAAFQAIVEQVPHLVVTELDLPDGSGLDLLEALHSRPATRELLVVVVSWRKGLNEKISALQAGAAHFLGKPVDSLAFRFEVKRLLYFAQLRLLPHA
jgi:PleD family two-component response regulator